MLNPDNLAQECVTLDASDLEYIGTKIKSLFKKINLKHIFC